eukprot:COSAG03_NODE_23658_length_278_cov_0.581006_1_plen_79_part_10
MTSTLHLLGRALLKILRRCSVSRQCTVHRQLRLKFSDLSPQSPQARKLACARICSSYVVVATRVLWHTLADPRVCHSIG